MKIKQQSKSDIKGLVDDIKVNVIENVGTADICDRLNIACNIKSLSCKFYYPLSVAKYCFGVPPWDSYSLPPQVSYGGTLELSKKLLFLKKLLQNQNYR